MTLLRPFTGLLACVTLTSAAHAADMQPMFKAPAVEQQATGYVEIYGGWADTRVRGRDCSGGECEPDTWFHLNGSVFGGAGRGNYWITRNVSVQMDAQAEGTSYNFPGGGRFSNHSYLVGGHWSWRDPQQYLFGLFAGAGDAGGGFDAAQRYGLIGAEAQWYSNQFTLYGQVGYDTTLTSNGLSDIHAWFV